MLIFLENKKFFNINTINKKNIIIYRTIGTLFKEVKIYSKYELFKKLTSLS